MKFQFTIAMLALPAISQTQDKNITQPITHECVFFRIITLKMNSTIQKFGHLRARMRGNGILM